MQQLTSIAPQKGVVKTPNLIKGKDEIKQERLSAAMLASQFGMEFPSNGLPVVMDEQEGPVAVRAEDLVSAGSSFLTDCSGQMVTVQPMMGG